MANTYTVATTDQGIYELPLTAGVEVTIGFDRRNGWKQDDPVTVTVHSGSAPVYASWSTVTVKDPTSHMIPPLSWATIGSNNNSGVVHLISSATAVVSVQASRG